MTKQEFLAMSLPYGLNCEVRESGLKNPKTSKMVMCGTNCCVMLHMAVSPEVSYNQVKPILHPLSDLTKEIEHKGEKFVPIVRLIEIAFDVEVNTNRVELSFEDDMYIAEINGFEFVFDITDNSLLSFRHNFLSVVPKQLELFQKLIEWHFDLFGGIENKEAINVNTLEINPYK